MDMYSIQCELKVETLLCICIHVCTSEQWIISQEKIYTNITGNGEMFSIFILFLFSPFSG